MVGVGIGEDRWCGDCLLPTQSPSKRTPDHLYEGILNSIEDQDTPRELELELPNVVD